MKDETEHIHANSGDFSSRSFHCGFDGPASRKPSVVAYRRARFTGFAQLAE
jgi:hypothetical protein